MFDLMAVHINARRLCRYADAIASGDDSAKADAIVALAGISIGMERQHWPDPDMNAEWNALPASAAKLADAARNAFDASDSSFDQVGVIAALGIAYGRVCAVMGHDSLPIIRLTTPEDEQARRYAEGHMQEAAE